MLRLTGRFWHDQQGFIISAELVLVATIAVLAVVVGLHAVSRSVVAELNDVAGAIGAVSQSYRYFGLRKWGHAWIRGGSYYDQRDICDCQPIVDIAPAGGQHGEGGAPSAAISVTPPAPAPASPAPAPTACPEPCERSQPPSAQPPCPPCEHQRSAPSESVTPHGTKTPQPTPHAEPEPTPRPAQPLLQPEPEQSLPPVPSTV